MLLVESPIPLSVEDGEAVVVEGSGREVEPGITMELSVGVMTEVLGPKIALVTPPSKLVIGLRIPPFSELEDAGDTVVAGGETGVVNPSEEVVPSSEGEGETIVGDSGRGVEPGTTIELSVGPGPKIALVTPPSKLVMGLRIPPPFSELEDVGDAVIAGGETRVVDPSKVVPWSEGGGEAMVGDEGRGVEPGITMGLSVGVVVEISEVPGPRIALVTPPSKLVMGLRIPPPFSELEDAGDTVVAGGETGVVNPSEEVVPSSEGEGETIVGDSGRGVEPGTTIELSVGPGPKIALVTPPSKLVMGLRIPPPFSGSEDVGDAVIAGGETGESVVDPSREVEGVMVLSSEDGKVVDG